MRPSKFIEGIYYLLRAAGLQSTGLRMPAARADISGCSATLEISLKCLGPAVVASGVGDMTTVNSGVAAMMCGDSGVAAMTAEDSGVAAAMTAEDSVVATMTARV